MNIRLFNKLYWLRQAQEQKLVKGHLVSGYEDVAVSLHVHPLSTNQIQALPEGERKMKRLEGHGEIKLNVGDEAQNRKGDLLYYHGDWYECLSCQLYDHTMLSHYNYQFVLVPRDASGATDLEPPVGEPTLTPAEPKGRKKRQVSAKDRTGGMA